MSSAARASPMDGADAAARARALRLSRAAEHYRRILAGVEALRAAAGGTLSQEGEAEWASRVEAAFQEMSDADQEYWCRTWSEFRGDLLAVLRARVGSLMGPPPPKPKHGPYCDKTWRDGKGCPGCNRISDWREVHLYPRQAIQCLNLEHVRHAQTLRSIQWSRTKDKKWGEPQDPPPRNRSKRVEEP